MTAPTPGTPATAWPTEAEWQAAFEVFMREGGSSPLARLLYGIAPLVAAREAAAKRRGAEKVAEAAMRAVPCICDEAYLRRQMEDPACQHHDLMRELDAFARAAAVAVPDTTHEGDPA